MNIKGALEAIVQCSSFWASRESVTEHSIVVEDDGRHYNVRVLDRAGKIAHAALAALQSVPPPQRDVRKALEALELAQQALNDWTATYAPDECGEEAVQQAKERISENGTLCYIADVLRVIRETRAALQSVPDGGHAAEARARLTYAVENMGKDWRFGQAFFTGIEHAEIARHISTLLASPPPDGSQAEMGEEEEDEEIKWARWADEGLIAHLFAFADRSDTPSAIAHLLRCAAESLAIRPTPSDPEDAITRLRRLLKLCKVYIRETVPRAMIDAELARDLDPAPGKIEPRIVGGPPCPTCGFRIREVPRQPFVFEDDDTTPAPTEALHAEAEEQEMARQLHDRLLGHKEWMDYVPGSIFSHEERAFLVRALGALTASPNPPVAPQGEPT